MVTQCSWVEARSPESHSWILAAHCPSLWHQIFPGAVTFFCFGEKEGLCQLCWEEKNKLAFTHYEICKTAISAILAQLYFSLSAVRFTAHWTHTTGNNPNNECQDQTAFSPASPFGRKGLLEKWCKMEQFCTAWYEITTCCQEQCKNFRKKFMIWMKIQGKADISRAVLHFKTARNAKAVKISVALRC